MGCRQVVRLGILIPAFVSSNLTTPAIRLSFENKRQFFIFFIWKCYIFTVYYRVFFWSIVCFFFPFCTCVIFYFYTIVIKGNSWNKVIEKVIFISFAFKFLICINAEEFFYFVFFKRFQCVTFFINNLCVNIFFFFNNKRYIFILLLIRYYSVILICLFYKM